jgi:hypothetical protein
MEVKNIIPDSSARSRGRLDVDEVYGEPETAEEMQALLVSLHVDINCLNDRKLCSSIVISEMPGLCWRRVPVIVTSVEISDRCAHKFVDGHVVKAGHIDCIEVAPPRRISDHKRPHTAVFAKQMLVDLLIK